MGRTRVPLRSFYVAVLALLYLPIAILFVFSFNAGTTLSFPLEGLTLEWYGSSSTTRRCSRRRATASSSASGRATLATLLGCAVAIAVLRFRFRGRGLLLALAGLPLIVPFVVMGVAFFLLFVAVDVPRSLLTVGIGHTVIAVPYATLIVLARLSGLDPALEDAAMDLGATYPTTLRRVVLPLMAPTLLSAWLTCFIVSFDEIALAIFLVGGDPTFPVFLYGQLRFAQRLPVLIAMAVLLMVGDGGADAGRRCACAGASRADSRAGCSRGRRRRFASSLIRRRRQPRISRKAPKAMAKLPMSHTMLSAPAAGNRKITTPYRIDATPARPSQNSPLICSRSRMAADDLEDAGDDGPGRDEEDRASAAGTGKRNAKTPAMMPTSPSRIDSHQLLSRPRLRMPPTSPVTPSTRAQAPNSATRTAIPSPAQEGEHAERDRDEAADDEGPPPASDLHGAGDSERHGRTSSWRVRSAGAASLWMGGGDRLEQPLRCGRNLRDGVVEGVLVRGRRLAIAAHLADVLEGGGRDLVVGSRHGAGAQGLDASAHARRIRPTAASSSSSESTIRSAAETSVSANCGTAMQVRPAALAAATPEAESSSARASDGSTPRCSHARR